MNTLEQHNEELLNDFNIIFGTDNEFVLGDNSIDRVKVFIQDQNKQLYIKIAEGEIRRLVDEFNKNTYTSNVYTRSTILEQFYYWQNILTELRK